MRHRIPERGAISAAKREPFNLFNKLMFDSDNPF
jgi:hypothetical protein